MGGASSPGSYRPVGRSLLHDRPRPAQATAGSRRGRGPPAGLISWTPHDGQFHRRPARPGRALPLAELTTGIVGQIFGVRYLATLFGVVFFSHQLGSFLGVWLGGRLFDATGSYDGVWWAGVALGLAAALIHLPIDERPLARRSRRRPRPDRPRQDFRPGITTWTTRRSAGDTESSNVAPPGGISSA